MGAIETKFPWQKKVIPQLLALEPRVLFDGAAAVVATADTDPNANQAVDTNTTSTVNDPAIQVAETEQIESGAAAQLVNGPAAQFDTNSLSNLTQDVLVKLQNAIADTESKLASDSQSSSFAQIVNQSFGVLHGVGAQLESLVNDIGRGLHIRLELLSDDAMQGAAAAYASGNGTDPETIYINEQWLSNGTTDAPKIVRALLEEYGHALDYRLNRGVDTPGDEGAVFANLLLGNTGDLSGLYGENDSVSITLANGQVVAAEATQPIAVAQSFILPMNEQDTYTSLRAISSAVTNQIWSISSITVTQSGTKIVYDNWEDGYEADPNNPTQSSTQIWGDGDLTNGVAPGSTNDILQAGSVITLSNKVDLTKVGLTTGQSSTSINSGYYYDGRDMIHATAPVSVTQAQYADTPGSVLAGAVNVYDIGAVGKNYVVPVGQGTASIFNYSSLHIVATADNTTITIDPDGAGSRASTTYTLNKGQTLLVGGMGSGVGITAGATVNSDKAIEVYAIDGATSPSYQNRWYALPSVDQWGSSYYAPVYTTNTSAPASVYLYNAGTSAIDVYYDTATSIGTKVTVAAGASAMVTMPTTASGAHFYTKNDAAFFALGVNDPAATWDWSYSLVPEKYLTSKFVLGWAPGNANTPAANGSISGTNGSPAWVTATADTRIYIDYSGDGGAYTAPNGASYDAYYDIKALETYRIFAPNGNQTGLTVFTTDGTLLAGAWGEDASKAGSGTPYLDMGYTALPYPDYVVSKSADESTVVGTSDGDGWIELGEQVEYSISLINRSVVDVYNINIKDVLGSTLVGTYVAGSAQLQVIASDGTVVYSTDSTSTPALDNVFTSSGYTLADVDPNTLGIQGLQRGYEVLVTYRTQLPTFNSGTLYNTLAAAGFKLTNDVTVTGSTAASSASQVLNRTVTNTTQVSVLTTDGTVAFYNDSTYSSVASSVAEAGTLYIQVTDNDANTSTGSINTLSVSVKNTTTGEVETVTLTETAANTGIFRGTLLTTTTSSDQSVASKLYALREQGISVDYTDPVYGASFDNPLIPAVPGIGTSLANTASLTVATPSQTKVLYLSSDTPYNLDRIDPVATSDTSTAYTSALANAVSVSITDNFTSGAYTGGTGWSGNWTETDAGSSSNPATKGSVRITSSMLEIRGGSTNSISRSFAALPSAATFTFDIYKYASNNNTFSNTETIKVYQYISGAWSLVATLTGADIGTSASSKSFSLSAGATGIKFETNGDSADDRVRIDNVSIASGSAASVLTSYATGTTASLLSSTVSAGQTFSISGTGSSDITQLSLSLAKTSGSSATATVTIRSSWDGAVLWTGTVSTSNLSTSFSDYTFSTTGLQLVKGTTYYIRIDSSASGIKWQGNATGTYTDGAAVSNSGTTTSADMRFAITGKNASAASVSFAQNLSMATDFVMPSGGTIKVVTYVDTATATGLLNGTMANITASLSANGTSLVTFGSATYNSTTGTLTWIGTLSGTTTIAAGSVVKLNVSNSSSASFKIAYDSSSAPSRIELPTTTVISFADVDSSTVGVQEVQFYDAPFTNGGSVITNGYVNAGNIVYIRFKVSDPFGDYDITSLSLNIDDGTGGATPISINLSDAYVINASSDGRAYKTYEYAWQTSNNVATYSISATANEGYESIKDTTAASFGVVALDLGTPSTTMFRSALAGNGGVESGAYYTTGAIPVLRVTDLDQASTTSTPATVVAVVNGYSVLLTETTAGSGIFEADLSLLANQVSNTNGKTNAEAAAYFASVPGGTTLNASYTDPDDSIDSSGDSIQTNALPQAANDARSMYINNAVSGNVISGYNGSGIDTDANSTQSLQITALTLSNGTTSTALGSTIVLPSGALLVISADGSYTYDSTTLTNRPTASVAVTDYVDYTISDGYGGTSTARLSLTINYLAVSNIANQTNTDGATIALDTSGNFSNLNGSSVFSISSGSLPPGLSINSATGFISGTIASDASDPNSTSATSNVYSVTVQATGSSTVTQTFTWTVTNVTPTPVNDSVSGPEDASSITGNVLDNDTDGSPDNDALTVSAFSISGIAGSFTAGTTARTITGKGSIVLDTDGSYTFTPSSNWNGTVPVITYTVDDGNGGTATATLTITVTPVNDAPVASGSATLTAINEDTASPSGATVSTLFTANFADSTDTVSGGSSANTLAGVAVVAYTADTAKGTWQYSSDGTGWTTLSSVTGNATARIFKSTDYLRFVPAANWNGSAPTLTVRLIDSSTTTLTTAATVDVSTNGGTTAISSGTVVLSTAVNAVNDAPVASGSATLTAINEDTASPSGATVSTLFTANFADSTDTVSGGSSANTLAGVAVVAYTADTAKGTWQYSSNGTGWTTLSSVAGDATARIFKSTDYLRFVPAANWNGSAPTLTVRLIDSSTTTLTTAATVDVSTNGGTTAISSGTVVLSTTVNAVNDAPSGTDTTVTTQEDTNYTFLVTDFGFTDAVESNTFVSVTITTLPSTGTLKLNGTTVTAGQVLTVADITAGKLVYTPVAHTNGASYPTFTFQVTDNGGTANGGIATDQSPNTMTIALTDTVPVANADSGSLTEDASPNTVTGNVISGTGSATADTASADGSPAVVGVAASSTGVNLDSSSTVGSTVNGSYGTITIAAGGAYTYTLDNSNSAVQALNNGQTLTDVFTYTIKDADGSMSHTTVSITINGANEAVPSVTVTDHNSTATGQESVSENASLSGKTFTVSAPGGLSKITVAGTDVTLSQLNAASATPVVINTTNGVLTITGYNSGTGVVTYSYDPSGSSQNHSSGEVSDAIGLTVTDGANQTSSQTTLTILITDTVPVANADSGSLTEDASPNTVTGNVISGTGSATADTASADGSPAVVGVAASSTGVNLDSSSTVGSTVNGSYGTITIAAGGAYTYTLDNSNSAVQALNNGQTLTDVFTYTIKDADGSMSHTTVSITINGANEAVPSVQPRTPRSVLPPAPPVMPTPPAPEPEHEPGTKVKEMLDKIKPEPEAEPVTRSQERSSAGVIADKGNFTQVTSAQVQIKPLHEMAVPSIKALDGSSSLANRLDPGHIQISQNTDSGLRNTLTPKDALPDSGGRIEYLLPQGTFSGGRGAIRLIATQKDGSPLPAWMSFDAAKGKFNGTPPNDATHVIEVKVLATDSNGNKAETQFKIKTKSDKTALTGKQPLSAQIQSAIRLRA